MNFGFNSNVRCGKVLYHVQTEDRGPSRPYFDTVVYQSGRVVYKRIASYEEFIRDADPKSVVKELHERLSQQHQAVIAELHAGTLELHSQGKSAKLVHTAPPVPAARPVTAAAKAVSSKARLATSDDEHELDLHLRNPNSWFAAGTISLEIELLEKGTRRRISDADIQACVEHERKRTPCAAERTDEVGCVTLQFPVPGNVSGGSSIVVRASDGTRYGELRFRLKTRKAEKSPAKAPQ